MKILFIALFTSVVIGTTCALSLGSSYTGAKIRIGANHKYSASYLKQQSSSLIITNPGTGNAWKYRFTVWTSGNRVFAMMTGQKASKQVFKPSPNSAVTMQNWQSNPTSTYDSRVFECFSVDPFDACNRITNSAPNVVIQLVNPHGNEKMCTVSGSSTPVYKNCWGSESHWWVHA
ncbi:uncharacterized protein [Watersipora subatra]|uniref:uncharacterized protein n=1 Tax=Watersipora subatra TaxID=2589382 RepID=UPI00355BCE08